jgi:hypothetical protein
MSIVSGYTLSKINDTERQNYSYYKFSLVPINYQLQDTRGLNDFKINLLGGYPKAKINTLLDKSLSEGNIEKGCFCAFQLLASGQCNQLWDKLVAFIFKNINIANPALPFWLSNKYLLWYKMVAFKEFSNNGILMTRNIQQFRTIISEMVIICCQSKKRKMDILKYKIKDEDFIIANFHKRCKSRDNILINGLCGANDPVEIKTAANEFCYHLLNKNIQDCLYWLNWILYWEKINIKKYKTFTVQARQIEGIPTQYIRDVIWLLWSIFHQVRSRLLNNSISGPINSKKLEIHLDALWNMYYKGWKPSWKSKRLPLFIWSIHYLIYPLDWNIPVIDNLKNYVKAVSNNNMMFAKMKKHCIISKYENMSSIPQASLLGNISSIDPNTIHYNNYNNNTIPNTNIQLGDIGSNSGLNIIIEKNDNPFYNNASINPNPNLKANLAYNNHLAYTNKKKQNQNVKAVLSDSMKKLNIMSSLDKYLQ